MSAVPVMRLALLLLCLLFVSPARADEVIEFQGRDVVIHMPPAITPGKSLPAVLAMHGGGGNAEDFIARYNLIEYADSTGMMIVFPEGTGGIGDKLRTWNAGNCCGGAKEKNTDDVGYLSALIDELVSRHGADPKRIYATGHSNGAMMSYRLACEIPDKIAAIAPVGAAAAYDGICGARHVPVLHIHGTLDQCARYEGGETCGGCFSRVFGGSKDPGETKDTWSCPPVSLSLEQRAKSYGCAPETESVLQSGPISCRAWKSCPAGSDITQCDVIGAGHAWPGTSKANFCGNVPKRMCAKRIEAVGPLSDADINTLIFDFFAKH
jgi:polyhydroxybutyrate depolymerase